MAHAGKFYPLALRRDFGMQLTSNRFSFPLRHTLHVGSYTGFVGAFETNKIRQLHYQGVDNNERLNYFSDWITHGFFTYRHVVEYFIAGNPQRNYANYYVTDRDIGLLFKSRQPADVSSPSNGAAVVNTPYYETPGVYTHGGEVFQRWDYTNWHVP